MDLHLTARSEVSLGFVLHNLITRITIQRMNCPPCLITTEGVNLPTKLLPSSERLAEKTNDLWGVRHIIDRWCCFGKRAEPLKSPAGVDGAGSS